jgi:crotonobetaine/carnitine-CoA ligase
MTVRAAELGATIVIKKSFKTQDFWRDIDRYGCTYTSLVGAMPHFILSQPPSESDAHHSLRAVGMTPVHPQYLSFKQRFGVEISTAYGMTECSGPFHSGAHGIEDPRSCGRLRTGSPFYEVRLVDEHDEEVPEGQVGELIVRTGVPWTMSAGYLGMPERTAEAWRNGWFHTGDAFRAMENGLYYFSDRLKDAIRRRGENISSFEVEAEVNKHPAVAESAAIAVPADDIEDEIKVFVVPRDGQSLDPADLIRFLAGRMTRFMIPRYVEIVSEFPKTHTLRVKKAELRARPAGATWDRVAAGIEIR